MATIRTGIYPGTFDPITKGHLEIIKRAAKLVDHLIIGVAKNDGKGPMFSTQERVEMVEAEVAAFVTGDVKIEVKPFKNLLVHFARDNNASVIIRGLRAVSDFEYEFQMTGMNYQLDPEIETVFLMATNEHQFISSRFVKEVARLDGDVKNFVSPDVSDALLKRIAEQS